MEFNKQRHFNRIKEKFKNCNDERVSVYSQLSGTVD